MGVASLQSAVFEEIVLVTLYAMLGGRYVRVGVNDLFGSHRHSPQLG